MSDKREDVARIIDPTLERIIEGPRYERAKAEAQAKADAIIALLSGSQDRDVGAWATSVASTILATLSMLTDARAKELADFLIIEAQKIIPPSVAGIPEGLINELDNLCAGLGGALSKVHCERFDRRHPNSCACEGGCHELRDTLRARLSASPSPVVDAGPSMGK